MAENDIGDELLGDDGTSAVGTITINPAPANDIQVYYKLTDPSTDTNGDKYGETTPGGDISFDVYVKNNGTTAEHLQAFDIFPEVDSMLTYKSVTDQTGLGLTDVDGNTSFRSVMKNLNLELAANGGEQKILTLTFTLSEDAVWGEKYHVFFSDSTSLGIDDTPADPMQAAGTIDTAGGKIGAQTLQTYTVQYDKNTTDSVIGMPSPDNFVKGHNAPVKHLSNAVPTRAGYKFKGWSLSSGTGNTVNYGPSASFNENGENQGDTITLYAVWEEDTAKVTVFHVKQKLNGTYDKNDTELTEKEEITDKKTGETFTPDRKSYTGFIAPAGQAVTVLADGSAEVVYQYARETYTVTWKNYDGSELEKDTNVMFGATPEYNSATPEKTADNENSYEFSDWSPAVGAISGDTEYTAQFTATPIDYTVSFDKGEHAKDSFVNPGDQVKHYNETITLPAVETADGYAFIGWFDGETNVGLNGATYTVTKNVTLVAKYEGIKYTVKFHGNGADNEAANPMADQEFTYGDEKKPLTTNAFTKTGSTFGGWATSAENANATPAVKAYSNNEAVNNLTTTPNGVVDLYAIWSDNPYEVTVNSGDHGTASADKATAKYKDTITVTVTPDAGYELDSLYYVKKGETAQNAIDKTALTFEMPASDVTVYATFKAIDYTVTVAAADHGSVTADKTSNAHVGDTVTLTVSPATGYKLKEIKVTWTSDTTKEVAMATDTTFVMPAADVTVTPSFEAITYTVKFDKGTGTGTMADQTFTYDVEQALSKNLFTKDGYHFNGWKNGADTYTDEQSVKNLAATDGAVVELTAQWEANTFTVTFNANEGTGTMADQTFTYDEAKKLSKNTFTRAGYDFDGWAETAAGDKKYADEEEVSNLTKENNGTVELFAKWKEATYTLSFDKGDHAKDGYNAPADMSVTYNGTYSGLTDAEPAPGYSFTGWFVGDNQIKNGDTVTITGDSTAVARYEAKKYTITLKYNDGTTPDGTIADYTIESTDVTLPTPADRQFYDFDGWYVLTKETEGNWEENVKYEGHQDAGRYGNVTLQAKWTPNFSHAIEDYKYAQVDEETGDQYVMLLIADKTGSGDVFAFEGFPMYYTTDDSYKLDKDNDAGTFVTLIPASYRNGYKLNDAGIAKLSTTAGDRGAMTINYTGDINNDTKVNIADANAVYQMVKEGSTGGYYSETKLDTLHRLMADQDKSISGTSAQGRASIKDVEEIIKLIPST